MTGVYMQPYEMTGEDLGFSIYIFYWRRGRIRISGSKWSAQVFKVFLPPISARAWRSVENMLVHIMIGSFQFISEEQ